MSQRIFVLTHWRNHDELLLRWCVYAQSGLFASTAVNASGANGLLYGNPMQLVTQLIALVVVITYTSALTWLILKVVDVVVGLRVQAQEEVLGLDTSQHGETAYQF